MRQNKRTARGFYGYAIVTAAYGIMAVAWGHPGDDRTDGRVGKDGFDALCARTFAGDECRVLNLIECDWVRNPVAVTGG